MNYNDIAMVIYIFLMVIAFFISYKYASFMIRKTGLFFAYSFIATMMNFMLLIMCMVGWFLFSWGVNEFLFFGGLYLSIIITLVSEFILFITLLVRRKVMLEIYCNNTQHNI
jgi:hypothetical protein